MVVERRPGRGAEVEVALDADAVEEVGNGLALRGRLDHLEVADEAHSDVALRLVDLHRPPRAREDDRRGETRRPGACNANR